MSRGRYDKPGHGETDVAPGPYSFELLADDVLALLDALQITQTHFVILKNAAHLEPRASGRVQRGGPPLPGAALMQGTRQWVLSAPVCVSPFTRSAQLSTPTTRPRLDHGEVVREAREDVRERALKCGPRRRDRLAPDEWTRRSALCDAESGTFVLDDPDYYCRYPISVLVARR